MEVVVLHEVAQLAGHTAAWDDLAAAAIEPNPFYEPWMLLPALEYLAGDEEFVFVLIYAPGPGPTQLCGFFPLVRKRRFSGIPVRVLALWQHLHCFLCTPLIRAGGEAECLAAFFRWTTSGASQASLLQFGAISGEGPFRRALTDHFTTQHTASFTHTARTRAILRPREEGAEAYLREAMSGRTRSDLRRKAKKLAELGEIRFASLEDQNDLETWIQDFLRCEASGWKGKEGGALACREAERGFFERVAREAFSRKKLLLMALQVDGSPVAMRCNFVSIPGSFFFKPAYLERFARFSPGVLLEVETIRRLHASPEIRWMDSCTSPDNSLLNDLWLDRILIETLVVPSRRGLGDLIVALLPLGRWLRRRVRAGEHAGS